MSAPWPTLSAPPALDIAPWGWNPAATFQTSFIAAREEQRAQREFEVAQELEQFLLPLKKQQAQLSLEKMNLEMEKTKGELTRQTLFTRMATDAYRNTNRGVNSAVAGNGGSTPRTGSNVATLIQNWGGGSATPAGGGGGGGKRLGQGHTGDDDY